MIADLLLPGSVGNLPLLPILLFVIAVFSLYHGIQTPRPNSSRWLAGGAAASLYLVLAVMFSRFVVDDVYISLRYARNLADGHGLVFNTDKSAPVEGYTNFLWVLFEALLFKLKLSHEMIIPAIRITGLIFGAGVVVMTYLVTRILIPDVRFSVLAAILLLTIPQFSFWAVGGLETSMYMFWMTAGIYFYLLENKKGTRHSWSVLFFFLTALTRPEGLFFAVAVFAIDFLSTYFRDEQAVLQNVPSRKNVLIAAFSFFALYGVYFLWRYNFYGFAFPNTFYAKKVSSAGYIIHRFKQVSGFYLPLMPVFGLAIWGLFALKNSLREKILLVSMLLTLIAFAFAARNEWMPGYRYEIPALPLLIVLAVAGIFHLSEKIQELNKPAFRSIPMFVTLILGTFYLGHAGKLKNTGDEFTAKLYRAHVPLGKWLKKYAPPGASYASWDMGAVPYYSGLAHIIDINSEGLLNPHTALFGYDIDRFLSSNPSFLVLPPDNDYVRPAEIREFYRHRKLQTEYEYLFSLAFDRQYLLNVYRHQKLPLTEAAINEGKQIEDESYKDIMSTDRPK